MNETIETLKSHVSVRKFKSESVSDEMVETIVEAATRASTSSNLQATTVIRVRNDERRQDIAKLAGNQKYVVDCGAFLVWCVDLYRSKMACEMGGGEFCAGMTEHFVIATVDVALAAQNAAIAAESLGLGICYIGGIRNDPAKMTELLALPKQVFPVFGMCIGWPQKKSNPKPRLPTSITLMDDIYNQNQRQPLEEYDQLMESYYKDRGIEDRTWTSFMSELLGKESRPHMRSFLADQGFDFK
ncbi:MAG: oxygen-insensitive NADPH nitroreductase [Planctomycetota bacterium]